ncbi:MAG: hypothetical protein PQJ59_05305 [Spirochaetales bacterium]|nr:hypothetical protein [Spirochaetales bacterium]
MNQISKKDPLSGKDHWSRKERKREIQASLEEGTFEALLITPTSIYSIDIDLIGFEKLFNLDILYLMNLCLETSTDIVWPIDTLLFIAEMLSLEAVVLL